MSYLWNRVGRRVSAVCGCVPLSSELARPDRPLSVSWSISSEQQREAYEAYRASMSEFYAVDGVPDGGRTGFYSRTTAWRFGPSSLARGFSSAQTLSRGSDEIRRSGLDHISIVVGFAGSRGDSDGRQTIAEPGAVQFRDLSRPAATRVERIDLINLVTPRTSVPSWLLGRRVHGLVLPPNSPGGRLVASHLNTLVEVAASLSEDEGVAAVEATFIIAERFLGQAGTITPLQTGAIQRTIRQRAMQIFDAHVADPTLDVAAVASRIGVSRSALYRAFEEMGGVQNYVIQRRLDRAYAMLRIDGGARASIEAVADQHGFSSRARFTRAFVDRFGFPPTDVAPAAHVGSRHRAAGADGLLDGPAHDVVIDWLRRSQAA